MSTEANRQTALKMISAMAEGRLDETLITDDITWWVPGVGTVSKAAFLGFIDAFRSKLNGPCRMVVHGVTAEGDRVAVEAESFAKLANGKTYNNTYHFLFVFRNGKICHSKEYNDSKHAVDTVGSL
jgi:ketosteroid isomerase-like protein